MVQPPTCAQSVRIATTADVSVVGAAGHVLVAVCREGTSPAVRGGCLHAEVLMPGVGAPHAAKVPCGAICCDMRARKAWEGQLDVFLTRFLTFKGFRGQ